MINCSNPFSVGDEESSEASVLEFDGKDWTETLKESYNGMKDNSQGNRAIAVNLQTSGFDEFCDSSPNNYFLSNCESFTAKGIIFLLVVIYISHIFPL